MSSILLLCFSPSFELTETSLLFLSCLWLVPSVQNGNRSQCHKMYMLIVYNYNLFKATSLIVVIIKHTADLLPAPPSKKVSQLMIIPKQTLFCWETFTTGPFNMQNMQMSSYTFAEFFKKFLKLTEAALLFLLCLWLVPSIQSGNRSPSHKTFTLLVYSCRKLCYLVLVTLRSAF